MVKILLFAFILSACQHMDYSLQAVKQFKDCKTCAELHVILYDDEITLENHYPKVYLYVYVNDDLVVKKYQVLSSNNSYQGKYFLAFDEKVLVKPVISKVKIIYQTYRENKAKNIVYENQFSFKENKLLEIKYLKNFQYKFVEQDS